LRSCFFAKSVFVKKPSFPSFEGTEGPPVLQSIFTPVAMLGSTPEMSWSLPRK
jgi:hypothetical protein